MSALLTPLVAGEARVSRGLVVEAGLAALPALLLAGALLAGGVVGPELFLFTLVFGLAAGVLVAQWRLAEARRLARWLDLVADDGSPPPPPRLDGALALPARPAGRVAAALALRDRRLTAQAKRLATIVAALPDPILLLDRHHLIRLSNPAADRVFGTVLRDLPLGRALRDPGVLAAVKAALAVGSASNITFSPVGDRTKRFAARVAPLDLVDGEPGVLVALREQTEQVMIERMRSDFVANASHEIRTPLAAIIGIVETLKGPARHDRAAHDMFLDTMADEAQRMQRLVDDLLSLSRVELVAHRPPEGLVALADVALDVARRLKPLAEPLGVALMLDLEPGLPRLRADSDQLHQLLANLVDNAVKYSPPQRSVTIELRRLDAAPADAGQLSGRPCLRLCVIDRGEGIAQEHLPRLTERFYRVDKARSRRVGGTGLGLAIVKHIIRRHEGHLAVTSTPGQGSRFCALFPLPVGAPATSPAPPGVPTDAGRS